MRTDVQGAFSGDEDMSYIIISYHILSCHIFTISISHHVNHCVEHSMDGLIMIIMVGLYSEWWSG